ncbi:MAG: excinuclease ABC subunit UvrC [Ferrovibrio sp.]|uniref:excinuclease ABC subunit UvrC n=1 Tax=Ferrovibrio sp. TaxID=1917215 RepID=UPI0026271A0C|nr:excinuclease ABC subunit UvrC [Ferrovibrio sp.]MCW0236655.1 excinuclease ABC subunit UvrC [Ferrovibrio sp.]
MSDDPAAEPLPGEPLAGPLPAEIGAAVIQRHLPTLPLGPGVYRMLDAKGDVLYIGKARSLRKRVTSYTKLQGLTIRIQRMVRQVAAVDVTTTHTEAEALLLEANLVKQVQPPFNVLLKDDKSFPYILVARDHPYPAITKHRGSRDIPGDYFGPFASTGSVHVTLNAMSRAFPLRSCSDSEFAARTRPCLQYQIKRCTAPCVERISHADYLKVVDEACDFLSGRNRQVLDIWQGRMQMAAEQRDYETAAELRDRIRALAHITQKQDINLSDIENADVIAVHAEGGLVCVQIFFFRAGQNFGNRSYFPAHTRDVEISEVLDAFIGQFYAQREAPRLILLSDPVENGDLIEEALSSHSGHKVELHVPQRGTKRDLVEYATSNARDALRRRLAEAASQQQLLQGVADLFGLETTPQRIEVYDNSHIMGRHAVGGMIVAGPEGLRKNAYRKFNIRGEDIEPGDDYGMMREVLTRRFQRLLKEESEDENAADWPDLLLIDGGKGQLTAVMQVMQELGVEDVPVVGIAKGPDRNAGREQFFLPGREPFMLEPRHPVLFFLQRLRDEAHRFAIGTHRSKRAKDQIRSPLDEIAGIGGARKKALLLHFGSAKAVSRAGLSDLEAVPGISKAVAKRIYDHFHGG